nr:Gag-Pol polyprotein [Tanacetum cinerariifolium]
MLVVMNQIGNGNLVAARAEGNAAGQNGNQIRCYNCRGVGHYARNCTVRPRRRDAAYLQTQLLIAQKEEAGIQLQAEEYDLMAAAADLDEIEEVNTNCIFMANLQQASSSGTQTDSAPVYDTDGSAENDNDVISEDTSVEQGGETVEQHPANFEETRALYESLYQNLAIEVEKVNSVNRKLKETNADMTTELARYKNQERSATVYEIPKYGDRNWRDAPLKKRGFPLNKDMKNTKRVGDNENQNPNLATPPNNDNFEQIREAKEDFLIIQNLGEPSSLFDFEETMSIPHNNQGPPPAGPLPQNNNGPPPVVRPNGPASDLQSMEELCQPSINGWGGPIAPIPIQATDFGLHHHMIQQVQNSFQFHGLPGDDANRHIDKFLKVTQHMKQNEVSDDALRLSLFPYSLTHHATAWHQDTINAAAGGTFMKKRPEECYDLIENMTAHHNHWDTSLTQDETYRTISSITTTESPLVVRQLEMMKKNFQDMMKQIQSIKSVNPRRETCGGPHSYTECPAIGGYTQEAAYATKGNHNSRGNF